MVRVLDGGRIQVDMLGGYAESWKGGAQAICDVAQQVCTGCALLCFGDLVMLQHRNAWS